ncbi:MAG: MFS transporter [Clostridiales bacterium]|nr:MFS transporter [Clostridiales bacterium]
MKLDRRRTILIGFAFLSICAFWQMYDMIVPLILRDTYHIGDGVSGVIMAMDNILALFMLPLFGRLSDRCTAKMGRRTPFIVFGTIAAIASLMALGLAQRHGDLIAFMICLGCLLVSMGTYRSPAVALMPDVTPKPLRSKANAVINLMGALGGVYTLIAIQLLVRTDAAGKADYMRLFFAVAAVMAIAVFVLLGRVRERALHDMLPPEEEEESSEGKLPAPVLKSLLLILFSVFFWYMGYNAVTTAYSKYFTRLWGDLSGSANCMMIATVGAVVSYIPVGALSSKIGRKRMILIGVAILAACFGAAAFIRDFSPLVYVLFVLIGFAWAAINVNSYPMVVEISRGADVGRYTGYYYTFSMAAQIVTPMVSGWLLEHAGYGTLFPYAAGMVVVSFITMLFVRHGDAKPEKAKSMLENFDAGD